MSKAIRRQRKCPRRVRGLVSFPNSSHDACTVWASLAYPGRSGIVQCPSGLIGVTPARCNILGAVRLVSMRGGWSLVSSERLRSMWIAPPGRGADMPSTVWRSRESLVVQALLQRGYDTSDFCGRALTPVEGRPPPPPPHDTKGIAHMFIRTCLQAQFFPERMHAQPQLAGWARMRPDGWYIGISAHRVGCRLMCLPRIVLERG